MDDVLEYDVDSARDFFNEKRSKNENIDSLVYIYSARMGLLRFKSDVMLLLNRFARLVKRGQLSWKDIDNTNECTIYESIEDDKIRLMYRRMQTLSTRLEEIIKTLTLQYNIDDEEAISCVDMLVHSTNNQIMSFLNTDYLRNIDRKFLLARVLSISAIREEDVNTPAVVRIISSSEDIPVMIPYMDTAEFFNFTTYNFNKQLTWLVKAERNYFFEYEASLVALNEPNGRFAFLISYTEREMFPRGNCIVTSLNGKTANGTDLMENHLTTKTTTNKENKDSNGNVTTRDNTTLEPYHDWSRDVLNNDSYRLLRNHDDHDYALTVERKGDSVLAIQVSSIVLSLILLCTLLYAVYKKIKGYRRRLVFYPPPVTEKEETDNEKSQVYLSRMCPVTEKEETDNEKSQVYLSRM